MSYLPHKFHQPLHHSTRSGEEMIDLLRVCHQRSFRWALTCVDGQRDEAEDLLQDLYVKILGGELSFRGDSSEQVWFFGVIARTALNQKRKLKRRIALLALEARTRWIEFSSTNPMGNDPSESYGKYDEQQMILKALTLLSSQQRQVIELVFYHEMTIAEAADVCNISLGSARTHYQRGKLNLARILEPIMCSNQVSSPTTEPFTSPLLGGSDDC